jgi:DNA-binding ferritin-like protein (Dps family)
VTVTDFEGKIIGKLKVMTANADKQETINLIKVYLGNNSSLDNVNTPEELMEKILEFFNHNAFNQSYINIVSGNKYEIQITDDMISKYIYDATYYDSFSQLLNEAGEIKDFSSISLKTLIMTVIDKEFSNIINNIETKGKNIVVIANRNKEMNKGIRSEAFAITDEIVDNNVHIGKYIIVFNSSLNDYATYTHEIAHLLGLCHSFQDDKESYNIGPFVPINTTQNYMDYAPIQNMFWKWQWNIIRHYVNTDN